ncbi:MAG: O-antigen ligase family protein [Synechococcales cyanobacterium]
MVVGAGSLMFNLLPSAGCLLAGLVHHRKEWWTLGRDPLMRYGLVLLGMMAVVTALGVSPWGSLAGSFNYWPFWLAFVGFSWALRDPQRRRWVMLTLIMGGLVLAILGLLDGIRIWGILGLGREYRPLAVFTSHNILGVWLVMLLMLSYGWRRDPEVQRYIWGFWLVGGAVVGLTGSRNSWGILCAGLVLLWLVKRAWIYLGGLLLAVALAVGAAIDLPGLRWLVPPIVWQRLRDAFDPQAAFFFSTQNRWSAWEFALGLIRQRPWTGWGWQSFAQQHNQQIPPPAELLGHAHNLYIHMAVEGGIPMLVGILCAWGWILWRGWQAWQRCPDTEQDLLLGINVALACYFLSGCLDVVFLDGRMNVFLWLLLAAANGAWLQYGRSHPTRSPQPEALSPAPGVNPPPDPL